MVKERFPVAAPGIASYDPAFDAEGDVLGAARACVEVLAGPNVMAAWGRLRDLPEGAGLRRGRASGLRGIEKPLLRCLGMPTCGRRPISVRRSALSSPGSPRVSAPHGSYPVAGRGTTAGSSSVDTCPPMRTLSTADTRNPRLTRRWPKLACTHFGLGIVACETNIKQGCVIHQVDTHREMTRVLRDLPYAITDNHPVARTGLIG